MSNTLLNSTIILNKSLEILHNKVHMAKNCNKEYSSKFGSGSDLKPGETIYVRKPMEWTVSTSTVLDIQDYVERSIAITCSSRAQASAAFSSQQLSMNIDDFGERVLNTAMARLATKIESDGFTKMLQGTANSVGTPGTTPASALVWLQAGAMLDDNCCDRDGNRYSMMNPIAQAATVNGLSGLFNAQTKISNQYNTGEMYDALGLKFMMSQNVQSLTVGSRSGTILIDGTISSEGSTTVHIDGLTVATETIKAYEVFTVAGVYAVNPETKASTGQLFRFKVTADATAASNEVDLTTQAIYTSASGYLQNVTALPVDGAAVTFYGTASTAYPQNLVYHKDAITLVTCPLDVPGGTDMAGNASFDGINMRMIRDYDMTNDRQVLRFDIQYDWTMLRPEHACRVWG